MTTEHEDDEGDDVVLLDALKRTYGNATAIEPKSGVAVRAHVDELTAALGEVAGLTEAGLAATADDDRDSARGLLAIVYARCAAVAIAAGDESAAQRWLREAERFAADDQLRRELGAARNNHERYRKLVHGRNLIANGRDSSARALWTELAKGGAADPIALAAAEELSAPRQLKPGELPTLWRYNGFGLGFYGSRDRWPDGSYATTHCLSALWIPLIPVGAYRVRDEGDGYIVMAREQLSKFARFWRLALLASVVVAITAAALNSHFNDPDRLARNRFDDVLATSSSDTPEVALRNLDAELASGDLWRVGNDRAERAGATVVRLTAGFVPKPFKRESLDQAGRLVHRYQALPDVAKGGAARDAVLEALDGWIQQLGDAADTAEPRLALLRRQLEVADTGRKPALEARVATTLIAVASSKEADWPLDALAILVEHPTTETIPRADKIVARLTESPSLLVDAGKDLDAWATATTSPTKDAVLAQRKLATDAQAEVEAEKLTAAQLAAMAKQRPWDQQVVLRQARDEASAGKLDAAAARLARLGAPGMMIRDARMLLGQLSSALGKLDAADALLSSLLGSRLSRYVAASGRLEEAVKAAEARVKHQLELGTIPSELRGKLEATTDDNRRKELLQQWFDETLDSDPAVSSAREAYLAFSDIVPVSLAAGTVKLRRAQAMPDGPARSAMLLDAERTFLAIRTQAEGQPEFRLGLGEIYARLGKSKESEAEFEAVLDKHDPSLDLRVASVYRSIGSTERATKVATGVFENRAADQQHKQAAAVLLGLLTAADEDESESWFRKADQTSPYVKTSLLSIEGRRLYREGKYPECAARFAAAAKAHLAMANATNLDGYNNSAVAQLHRFLCSNDPSALTEAEAALEKSYRADGEDPIVVGNFANTLESNGKMRVLGKRIDLRALHLGGQEVDKLLEALLDSPERDAVLADLAADPGIRRSEDLLAQFETLAPNNSSPYVARFDRAVIRRDEAAAAAVVDRAKKTKSIDVSDAARAREKRASGANDDKYLQANASNLARLEEVVARPKLDARTRAAGLFLIGTTAPMQGLYKLDAAIIQRGRAAAIQAARLWTALRADSYVIGSLIDEAALAADAKAWIALRRQRASTAALDKLAADNAPLAAAIKASKQWSQVLDHARADTSTPGVNELRLARMLGDAALETRAKAVLDNKLKRLATELELVFNPGNPSAKENLAYLDKR